MAGFDNNTPAPLYEKVKQFITDGIRSGEWEAGGRLPSEIDLVERLGVSRMTVHRALRELMAGGIIVRMQGVGTFVSSNKPQSTLIEMRDIADEIEERGNLHHADVKVLETITLDPPTAESIGLRSGQKVFHSLILHYENDDPVQVEERWINAAVFPKYGMTDFTRITPYKYLTRSVPVSEIEHVLHAILPDKAVQSMLKVSAHEPCLLLMRRTWTKGKLATSSRFVFPGARYSLGSRYKVDGEAARPSRLIPLKTRRTNRPRQRKRPRNS
jgi:GntR family transcriptional regulator, histidine utilization repressor